MVCTATLLATSPPPWPPMPSATINKVPAGSPENQPRAASGLAS
jgi:hypothetical protein